MRPAVPVHMRADRSISDSAFFMSTGLLQGFRPGRHLFLVKMHALCCTKAVTGRSCLASQLEFASNIDAHLSALARRAVFYYSNS